MVQSRFAEAAEWAREAIGVARAVGHREAEAIALNALGTALGDSGEVDAGVAYLRESLAIASEEGLEMEEGGAWINIADVLNLAGRTEEALEAAREGLETAHTRTGAPPTGCGSRCPSTASTSATGTARRRPSRPRAAGTPAARSCTGRRARPSSRSAAATSRPPRRRSRCSRRRTAELTEPQFIGTHGVLRAELARRRGDMDAARAAIDDALDRIEFCSEDIMRITALAAQGVRVEADIGEAARDRRDPVAEPEAARSRADALLERARVAAQSGFAVEAAHVATARPSTPERPATGVTSRLCGTRRPNAGRSRARPIPRPIAAGARPRP